MRDDHQGDRKDAHAKLWSMIKGIRVAMLTSWDGQRMHARPMHGYQEGFEGELWFFTRLDSGKTHEVMRFDQVNLAYADTGSNTYVSVAGRAEIVLDRETTKRFWNPHVSAWFPKGLDDPDLALIKVTAEGAEYWDSTSSSMRYFWEVATANLTGREPQVGENKRLDLERTHAAE
jgi:general stress protein 26